MAHAHEPTKNVSIYPGINSVQFQLYNSGESYHGTRTRAHQEFDSAYCEQNVWWSLTISLYTFLSVVVAIAEQETLKLGVKDNHKFWTTFNL